MKKLNDTLFFTTIIWWMKSILSHLSTRFPSGIVINVKTDRGACMLAFIRTDYVLHDSTKRYIYLTENSIVNIRKGEVANIIQVACVEKPSQEIVNRTTKALQQNFTLSVLSTETVSKLTDYYLDIGRQPRAHRFCTWGDNQIKRYYLQIAQEYRADGRRVDAGKITRNNNAGTIDNLNDTPIVPDFYATRRKYDCQHCFDHVIA